MIFSAILKKMKASPTVIHDIMVPTVMMSTTSQVESIFDSVLSVIKMSCSPRIATSSMYFLLSNRVAPTAIYEITMLYD